MSEPETTPLASIEAAIIHEGGRSMLAIASKIYTLDDWERLVATINPMANALWPDPEPDEPDEPDEKVRKPRTPSKATGLPDEGSFDRKVLSAALEHGADAVKIADLLDKTTGVIAMSLVRLRRRGCL